MDIDAIVKEQNKELLKIISEKYNIDYEKLLTMYNTPTFYCVKKEK